MRLNDLNETAEEAGIDKFVIALRNHIGRASSQKVPAKLNWEAVSQMSRMNGFEFMADYETFKSMYDSNPVLQELVHNFNDQGIVLNVPGTSKRKEQPKADSQGEIDKIAASNAENNLGDSIDHMVLASALTQQLAEAKEDKLLAKYGISKDKVTQYQIQQHKIGDKIDWVDARDQLINQAKAKDKAAAKAARQANPKPRKPRQAQGMTKRQYEKTVKAAGQDFMGDTASDLKHSNPGADRAELMSMAYEQLGQVAWDLAGSLMYNKEIDNYVRKMVSRNTGTGPDQVRETVVQEIIADDIYSAASMSESVTEDGEGQVMGTIQYYDLQGAEIDKKLNMLEAKFPTFEIDYEGYKHTSTVPFSISRSEFPQLKAIADSCPNAEIVDEAKHADLVSELARELHEGLTKKKESADLDLAIAHAYEELDDAQECNDQERCDRLLAAIKRYKAQKKRTNESTDDLECTDSDPCGYCKKCKKRGTLKVKEGFYPSKKLTKSDPIEKWIEHFQKSTNPRFKGKTAEERKKMAIGAFKSRQ